MASLYEGFTLCGFVSGPNGDEAGIQGVEQGRDVDHVIVTDSKKSVTVYKVSDQKPLGSWTVKQGQTLTCPAVFNSQTGEYVVVTDNRVVRVWKDEDAQYDKAFKATVSADVVRVHSVPDCEPVVLFARGAVRLLDSLLGAPQQSVEDVLPEDELIMWSGSVVERKQQVILFTTEQKGSQFLYLQRFNPNSTQKYRLEAEKPGVRLLSVFASVLSQNISLLYLYSNGSMYQSEVSVSGGPVEGVHPLPRMLLLKLSLGEDQLSSASALTLDEANVAVVGAPHPSAGPGREFLSIWNTHFQTLQAAKEMTGRVYGQLWCYSGKLYVPHGKALTAVPFECQRSSLASALGRLKEGQSETLRSAAPIRPWNTLLQGDAAQTQRSTRGVDTRRTRSRKSQAAPLLTVDQVLEEMKTAPGEVVAKEVEVLLSGAPESDLQVVVGQLASQLVARCQSDPGFYLHATLVRLVHTQCLCHSVCPDLLMLALEKKDYSLAQLCLQHFPDIPEGVTCACLKAFVDVLDSHLEAESLEPDSVAFMEGLVTGHRKHSSLENGFIPALPEEKRSSDTPGPPSEPGRGAGKLNLDIPCPVSLKKASLLNEILQTPHTESFLLPHLKDLSVQQVLLFLQYLWFLYVKYSQDANTQLPGLRSPTAGQIIDWVCLMLDAHFTVLVLVPEARDMLLCLKSFVRSQVRLFSELGKIQSSLQDLPKLKQSEDVGLYSIEIIELF